MLVCSLYEIFFYKPHTSKVTFNNSLAPALLVILFRCITPTAHPSHMKTKSFRRLITLLVLALILIGFGIVIANANDHAVQKPTPTKKPGIDLGTTVIYGPDGRPVRLREYPECPWPKPQEVSPPKWTKA